MNRLTFLLLFYSRIILLPAQEMGFVSPVNIPMELTGNFGELRQNHFHAGIDIRTNGATGLPVSSIADGFISRISVSPSGYGKALYVTHPNGYTSVYAHLEHFMPEIESWVREQQYRSQSFGLNLYPDSGLFPVKKGERIGFSGNSGSSGGPHLHFEIRDTRSEHPVNPLRLDYHIKDTRAPVSKNLIVYPLDDESSIEGSDTKILFPLVLADGAYRIKGKTALRGWGKLGFGFEAIDYFDANWSSCGIYRAELWIDGEMIHSFRFDELNYNEMRYINSHIDYEERILQKRYVHKTFLDPGNHLSVYEKSRYSDGYTFDDEQTHEVRIVLTDISGNNSKLLFTIVPEKNGVKAKRTERKGLLPYDRENRIEKKDLVLTLPSGALYTDLDFLYEVSEGRTGTFSKMHQLHSPLTPLHRKCSLSIKADHLSETLADRALIAHYDPDLNRYNSVGGTYEQGWVHAETDRFGTYCILVDTINPSIIPLSIKDKNSLTENNRIRFRIKDQLSGIERYSGYLDGEWVLFEYDPKNNLITYWFDNRMKKGIQHTLRLQVEDGKGNQAEYSASFYY